ncbi:MAG: SurA N-terminal domain-containing protein [Pseudolabrys sp.]|nr:SurA N-terminal domain-containing protein [Pseudolabrys sp.]
MLRGIHKASSTWLGKALMAAVLGFLVISFAIWGIGDIFRGFGRNAVATVGGAEISVEQFRQYYGERLRQAGQQLRQTITPEKARALGLDRQILGQLIAETALDERARDMRLNLSDDEVAKRIMSDPAFRGPNGEFDRNRFTMLINQMGFTEARFVAEQRNVLLRRQIARSLAGGLIAPRAAVAAVDRFRNQKRNVDYLSLGPAQAGDIPAPTADELRQYFEDRKALFSAPEYRKLTILTLSPVALAKPEEVSDADAQAYYEQHKAQFGEPERREVREIVFAKPEEAAAARARIDQGASFDDIAQARGLKPADTDLGLVAKSSIIDPAVADVAFSLKPGEVSQPVAGRFGTVLVSVGKIVPGEQKTYAEVAAQIKKEIATARARTRLGDLRDKIEDEKAAGATLAEAARKLGLAAVTIDAVDRSGRGRNGEPVPDLPKTPDVVAAAFASDVGVDNEPLALPDGGYLYFDVDEVIPSHPRTLAEVKDAVAAAWRDDEIAKRLAAKAQEILGKLGRGETFAQAAEEAGLQVQKGTDLQRGKASGFVPAKLVDAAFRTPKNTPGTAEGDKPTERFVYMVTAVEDPALDPASPEAKAIATSLENAYADDVIGEYVARLESDYGVSVNQAALNQVVGGEPGG